MGLLSEIKNNLKESQKLKEGAGAGYTIGGEIAEATVNNFTVTKESTFNDYGDRTFEVTCDIDVTIDDLTFESYYHGDNVDFPVYAKVIKLTLDDNGMSDDHNDLTDEDIKYALEGTKFSILVGGGYTHTKFTGMLDGDAEGYMYSDFFVSHITLNFTQDEIVNFIDNKVSGSLDDPTYDVMDDEGSVVESFDNEESAIEYAKANDYAEVVIDYHNFHLVDPDGSMDDEDVMDNHETIWSRDGGM